MYLRTPKRYSRGQRRSLISLRWLWLWLLTPVVILGGLYIYNQRENLRPEIEAVMGDALNQAQSSLSTLVAPTPLPTENPVLRLDAADAAWRRGAIEEAINILEDVAPAVPNDVNVHYRLALGLAMEGQLDEALEAAENTITADPYAPDAWAIRAMVLAWSDRAAEAIPSALRAIELAGDSNPEARARAQAFLAEAYLEVGQFDRALSTVENALEANPDSFEAYRNRARIVQETQFDFDAALADLDVAYALAPNLPYLTVDLAVLYLREGRNDEAATMLRDLIEMNPRNTRALFWMGWYYLNTVGDPNQAVDYLSRCVETAPENITCHYTLGRAQMRLEQYTAASESFETTINLGSTDPYHFWWAGRAQVVTNGCPAARPFYQRGWELARDTNDSVIIDSYRAEMQSCQMLIDGPVLEPTPEPEATEEATDA